MIIPSNKNELVKCGYNLNEVPIQKNIFWSPKLRLQFKSGHYSRAAVNGAGMVFEKNNLSKTFE